MDESSLRSYFRKILGVQPGASRSALRSARDKRAQRWRALLSPGEVSGNEVAPAAGEADVAASLIEPNSPEQKLAEQRLAMTNTAYDCLSNAEKFREFQIRLGAGDAELPDLDETLSTLGESNVKPVAARVLAKRQALMQEKMERVLALATESVVAGGHEKALKLTQGKLPDADKFYDAVYKAGKDAGDLVCRNELADLYNSKIEIDESFQSEVESVIVDQAEMIAHKEYDRLEERAATTVPTAKAPRIVALTLSLIIMGLVVSVCFYGATSQPTAYPTAQNGSQNLAVAPNLDATTMPVHVPAGAVGSSAAPAAGIANSVFNRSVFGPANSVSSTPSNDVAASQNGVSQQQNSTPNVPPPSAVVVPISPAEIISAEVIAPEAVKAIVVPDEVVAKGVALLNTSGAAGLAGYPTAGKKSGGTPYVHAIDAAMKQSYDESLKGFQSYFASTKSKEALYNEGIVLSLKGQSQASVDAYTKLLAIDPSIPQGLYNRALSHSLLADQAWNAKDTVEWRRQLLLAVNNYDLAVKADPRMSQSYYNRGIAHFRLGMNEQSYDDFTKARSLMPESIQAASYNQQLVGFFTHKNTTVPKPPAPPPPIGPVGPPGPK